MEKSNYEILELSKGASQEEIRQAFRRLALQYHSDRGGDEERFKEIKQAYDDLRVGLSYKSAPGGLAQDDSAESIRKNTELARQVAKHMQNAELWASKLVEEAKTDTRLFGSPTLGEIELERKANGVLSIKGNIMAGRLYYQGPIIMRGTISSPTRGASPTEIVSNVGNIEIADATKNRYRIENGARLIAKNGNIIIGNAFGKKRRMDDPQERVGVYTLKEYRTLLEAPNGSVYMSSANGTVEIRALAVELDNALNDVHITARDVIVRGNSMTHDVQINLKKSGSLKFLESHSILGLSDDVTVMLENGKAFSLHELKVKKIRDLPHPPEQDAGNTTLVGNGYSITYEVLDSLRGDSSSLVKRLGRIMPKRG